MLCAIAFTVQPSSGEVPAPRGSVFFVVRPNNAYARDGVRTTSPHARNAGREGAGFDGSAFMEDVESTTSLPQEFAMADLGETAVASYTSGSDIFALTQDFDYAAAEIAMMRADETTLSAMRCAPVSGKKGSAYQVSISQRDATDRLNEAIAYILGENASEEDDDVIWVEHRGKGVVRRTKKNRFGWPYALWGDAADLHGHFMTYHELHDGFLSMHVGAVQRATYNYYTTSTGNTSYNAPAYIGGGAGGGGAVSGGGYRPAAPAAPAAPAPAAPTALNPNASTQWTLAAGGTTLAAGNWLLDLSRAVELNVGAPNAGLALNNASLAINSGRGLVLDLQERWDGATPTVIDLVSLGDGSNLTLDGAALTEGTDYLNALGDITLRYTDAAGNTNSVSLREAVDSDLTYALRLQGNKLSLVVDNRPIDAPVHMGATMGLELQAVEMAAPVAPMQLAGDANPFTWHAGKGETLTWQVGSPWEADGTAYANKNAVYFVSDGITTGTDAVKTTTVTLGGDVKSGNITMTGEDNVTIDLNQHTLTLGGDLLKTENGTLLLLNANTWNNKSGGGLLTIKNGTFSMPHANGTSGKTITFRADYVTFKDVELNILNDPDYTTAAPNSMSMKHNSIVLDSHGVLTFDNTHGKVFKINALYDGNVKGAKVVFTNNSDIEFVRGSNTDAIASDPTSAFETSVLMIDGGSKVKFLNSDSLKAKEVTLTGNGSLLSLRAGFIMPTSADKTTKLTLADGATLRSINGNAISLAATPANKGFNLDVYVENGVSHLTGKWTFDLSRFSTLTYDQGASASAPYLTVGNAEETGNVNITAASSYFELRLADTVWDPTNTRTDYTLFKVGENSSLTIAGNELVEHKDYARDLQLGTISVVTLPTEATEPTPENPQGTPGTPLTRVIGNLVDNEQYDVFVIKVGDELRLRVVDRDHGAMAGGYHWDNGKGGTLKWSGIGWQNDAYFSGSDVFLESDGITEGAVADTTVAVNADVVAGAVTISGEDNFTVQSENTNRVAAATIAKSGSGTLTIGKSVFAASGSMDISGGVVHLVNGGSVASPLLQITNASLVLENGSQINTTVAGRPVNIVLNGANLVNKGDSLPFCGTGDANLAVTLTPTGTASHITGQWNTTPNFTLDTTDANYTAPIIGGDNQLASLLTIGANGFNINVGDKWDGENSLVGGRIKLFELGDNASLQLGTAVFANDAATVSYRLGLGESPLGSLNVVYEGGRTNLTQFSNVYNPILTYERGALYLDIVRKGEYVWKFTDGASMTWSQTRWGADAAPAMERDFVEYEHVRFTGDDDPNTVSTSSITINAVREYHTGLEDDPEPNEAKPLNTISIGSFAVEGEDNFTFNIKGRVQTTGFTKTGSGTATLICDTEQYRPVFKVGNGDFLVSGGTLDASRTQLELENGNLVIDGSTAVTNFIAKFRTPLNSSANSLNLKNTAMSVTGAGATAEVHRVVASDSSGRTSSIAVSNGATLSITSQVVSSRSNSGILQVPDLTVRNGGTVSLADDATVKVRNFDISGGGTLSLTMGADDGANTFTPYSLGQAVNVNLTNGGVLRNGREDNKFLSLNGSRLRASNTDPWTYSQLKLTLTGTASVLEGNWKLDASQNTVIRFANADTSALSIRNGTLDIINANAADAAGALTFDLSGVWNGISPVTQRLFRTISGGDLTINGSSIAAGDVTSLFNHVYVRYGAGADDIIDICNVNGGDTSRHYQLLWQNGSLFFTLSGQDANGPFIWRHAYELEYAPIGSTEPRKLVWSEGEVWRPASDTFGGPSGEDTIVEARYKNGHAVSFVGDTDGVVDDVLVTVVGAVAPGDSTQGEAGIRVTGADNYTFTGGLTYRVGGEVVHRIEDPENAGQFIYCKLDENHAPVTDGEGHIITYDEGTVTSACEAEIGDHHTDNNTKLPTTLSKSGTGTLTIDSSVRLTYSGRTEILEGMMHVDAPQWAPAGIITVAQGATLMVGTEAGMGSRQSNILSLGSGMVDNNGLIHTNILLPTNATISGNGQWKATYFNMNDTSFHAGVIELQPVAVAGYDNASVVANNTDIFLTQYFAGAGQNLTLANRSTMTVQGRQGADATHAAAEAHNVIISGEGSSLDFTGGGTLRAEIIDVSHGATLGLGKSLEHVGDSRITFTLAYGSTMRNNGTSSIVLNPSNDNPFNMVVKAKGEPNYFVGNWTVDLAHPFELDFSYFDNDTTVVPIVVREGTMTLKNASSSFDETRQLSDFAFRADGLKYDTMELMTVGERGKIALNYLQKVEEGGSVSYKDTTVVLSSNMDYFRHLDGMGYWFHVDALGYDTQDVAGTLDKRSADWDDNKFYVTNDGWRYVDLVKKTTLGYDDDHHLVPVELTDAQFSAYTGLQQNVNFKLLYESNVLSLVISPQNPIGGRNYYVWNGRDAKGKMYETWTRHNSTELSPWLDNDIFQNGYLTIFADVDFSGKRVGSYTVEIENAVATGSAATATGRPGFTNAGIYFGNRSVAGYTLQSDKYHGSGYIADLSETDITKVTVEGGYVEIKTNNTYGGKLSKNTSDIKYSTIVSSVLVNEDTCAGITFTGADNVERTIAGNTLYSMDVAQARAAHLVNYSRYSYAYQDKAGEVHFITAEEFASWDPLAHGGAQAERVYITQRTDGSSTWSVRGATIPITVKNDLAVIYSTEVTTAHAYLVTDENNVDHVRFISGADWDAGTYAREHAMEVILTPTKSDKVSWSVVGMGVSSTFFESISETNLPGSDSGLVASSTSTYAFAYRDPEANGKFRFVSEQDYALWKAWNGATDEASQAATLQAFKDASPTVAAYAEAHPDVTVEYVYVRRTSDGPTTGSLAWTVGNTAWGEQENLRFGDMGLNKVYAYRNNDNSVHVLTQEEYAAWTPGSQFHGHDVVAVEVFGPLSTAEGNTWKLYSTDAGGNRSEWGTVHSRPEFVTSENAYLRTQELNTAYAYASPDPGSPVKHVHFITEQQCTAWQDWAAVAYKNGATDAEKTAAYNAFVVATDADFAAMAKGLAGVVPEPVKLTAYDTEQSYHVTGAFVHSNLSTRAIANNFTYAYATTDAQGTQSINIISMDEFKAWQKWHNASEENKDAAYAELLQASQQAGGSTFAADAAANAAITPERVDLAYNTEVDNATGATVSYWNVRGANIVGRADTLVGEKTYGSAFVYAYKEGGQYHVLSETEYNNWNADAPENAGRQRVRVDMTAESTIALGEDGVPYSDTQWTLRDSLGNSLGFEDIGSMAAMSGKVYSYAYNIVDSMGRTHVHFLSAEDFLSNAYISQNPLKVTLSVVPGSTPTYSWNVRGTGAGSELAATLSTRTIANNYGYAYKTVDGEGNEQVTFISAAEYRAWQKWNAIDGVADPEGKAAALAALQQASADTANSNFATVLADNAAITPERVDLTYTTRKTGDVTTKYWTLTGATINTTMDTLNGEYTYGCAFLYAYKTGTEENPVYHFITAEEAESGDHADVFRVDMVAETKVNINPENGNSNASSVWTLRTADGEEIDFSSVGGMAALAGKVYSYAYKSEDGSVQFLTAADYHSGSFAESNPELVSLTMTSSYNYTWNVEGGEIDAIVDASNIPANEGLNTYTDVSKEHYTYVLVTRDELGNYVSQFVSERDYNDNNLPNGATKDQVQRLVLVQQDDGLWFVPEKGYTMNMETLEVTVDTTEFFGYGFYDQYGRLHLTTQDYYHGDNSEAFAAANANTTTPLGNTQLIRLAYDEKTGKWYTPGVLVASNEHALGTSEVQVQYGSRLLATTNLYLTSLTMETGSNVIARGNLDINKPLTVGAGSYFEVDGTLTVDNISVGDGAEFITHNVKFKNVVIGTDAKWNLNSRDTSVLDISDRLVIHGGAEITGSALLRDGLLQLVPGDVDHPYITITGSLKLGVDATLDLTQLMAEGAGHHYSSPLRVSEGGSLILEPHDSLLLSMEQVNHLLSDHYHGEDLQDLPQNKHALHVATLGAGANFYITTETREGDTIISSEDLMLPAIQRDTYDELPGNVQLSEGLGYLLDASLIRRTIATGADAGLDEVVLYIKEKAENPAYVWNGVYNGYQAEGNDNLWSMYNGGTRDGDEITTDSHAWSGGAIYGDPGMVHDGKPYENWGNEVYFLEVGRDSTATYGTGDFNYHYVNAGDKAANDLTYRSKYVDISGPVWSQTITVDVDRLYDMTLDQYLRNVGYMFYSSDGTGTITDSWARYEDDWDAETGQYKRVLVGTYALSDFTQAQALELGLELQKTNVVKNGTGVLTFNTENSFSGNIYLNSGSVFATNEKALGTSHVKMQDQTGLYINFLFEMKGDSNYRNPVLPNDITVWGGGNFVSAENTEVERAMGTDRIISVTVGYNPISVIDVMCDLNNTTTADMKEESTSRHWRTLSIIGALHGEKNTEIRLQGYTSYTGGYWYTSMFHIYGSEGVSDFAGTIKLENYRNTSPAAYKGMGDFMNDTNAIRGTGAVELMLSDGTLKYATLDLTRQNVLAAYKDQNGNEGFGRRQTPTHVVLLQGNTAVAGLNAEFLGTIVRAERNAKGEALSSSAEILVATQGQELTCVRTIATGNYTLSLHSDEGYDYVYSGVVGGKYAYAGQGSGTIPEAGEDASGTKISQGLVSVTHTGDGAQYIHTGYLENLTIGNEAVGTYEKATGGLVGFHYLDLTGNLTLHSGATLLLDVDDCERTANADRSRQNVHWDESAFSSNNVVLHEGRSAVVVTSRSEPGVVSVYDKENQTTVQKAGRIPVGSLLDGSMTVEANATLEFRSRGIEPLPMADGGATTDLINKLTDPSFHPEAGVSVTPPDNGFLLDITGALILKGDVHVDFSGVEFGSAENGVTYYLARAQKGIIGTVNQQTISLGNGYYGIIRGLETYARSVSEVVLPGTVNNAKAQVAFQPSSDLIGNGTDVLRRMDDLTSVRVYLEPGDENSYYFDYKTLYAGAEDYETKRLTLTQVTGNIYHYEVAGNSYEAVVSTDLPTGQMVSTLNLLDLAYADSAGYIVMTVTNTPPRVWFNTDNVIRPTKEISGHDLLAAGDNVLITPGGSRFINAEPGTYAESTIGFGDVGVDTLWTLSGPDAHSWIDEHLPYGIGCRVQFNRFGTARYQKVGDEMVYTRGYYTETLDDGHGNPTTVTHGILQLYNGDNEAYRGEYGMYVSVKVLGSTKEVWRGMVAEMYGEQFDIVELEGDVQARSIFVDCETGIHGDDADKSVLLNSPRSGNVNYWFRSAETDDAGRIGDIEVTDINHKALTANNMYDVKIGQVLATTLEKTGGGYLRISTHNTYSGGTYLKDGSLIIDCDDALGKASTKTVSGGGDGALHAYDGSTLFLNYVGENDTTKFNNDINVYVNSAASAHSQQVGFTVVNGINLNGAGNVHFVNLTGAITAANPNAVITLSGLIVAENNRSFHDYTSFTLDNLEKYSGVVRLDSRFASNAEGVGTVDGVVVSYEGGNPVYDYVVRERVFTRTGNTENVARAVGDTVDPALVQSHYDEPTRTIRYFIDETVGDKVTRTYLSYTDTYRSITNTGTAAAPYYRTYEASEVYTGGEVGLRITGNSLGDAIIDLSLNSATHNALVLDMAKATNNNYSLKGVRGLEGGEITYVTKLDNSGSGWEGYSSNVVTTKRGNKETTTLGLDVAYGDALYAGTVGYGYYHASTGANVGLIYPSAAIRIEKTGASTQSIFSARLDGLNIQQGNIQFVKDLILSGTLKMSKEAQLIIGTPGKTMANFNTTFKAPYSIVVQGEGILALGGEHTTNYTTTTDGGTTFNTSTNWSAFSTDVADYSEDLTPNMLLSGGKLTAVTDVSTSLSAVFSHEFTIDSSHYDYEKALLGEVNFSVDETGVDKNHTIRLSGRLSGSGKVTVTGGGTVAFDKGSMYVYDEANQKALGQVERYNVYKGTSNMLFRVEGGTTFSLNKDSALAYYGEGYTEKLHTVNGKNQHTLVGDGSTGLQSASTLEVADTSRAVVENGINALITAARLEDSGALEVGRRTVDGVESALVSVKRLTAEQKKANAMLAREGGDPETTEPLPTGSVDPLEVYGVGGDPETLNMVNIYAAESEGKASFTGLVEGHKEQNIIRNDAEITVAEGVELTMNNLTLGSKAKDGVGRTEQDTSLVMLEKGASLKLENVLIETFSTVSGVESYTGTMSAIEATGKELVDLGSGPDVENGASATTTTVNVRIGDNLLRPGESFEFTGTTDKPYDYSPESSNYYYSDSRYDKLAGQAVYELTNFQDCIITGGGGALVLRMSLDDYNELIAAAGREKLLGLYMRGVAVSDAVNENLVSLVTVDADNNEVNRGSVFYVTATGDPGANNGTVFYIDTYLIPEPTTTTLSLLALSALLARRRRREQQD